MIHVTKQLDFSEGPLGVNLVVKRIRNLLDSNMLIRLRVQSRAIHTQQNKNQTKISIFHSQPNKKESIFFLHSRKYHRIEREKKKRTFKKKLT